MVRTTLLVAGALIAIGLAGCSAPTGQAPASTEIAPSSVPTALPSVTSSSSAPDTTSSDDIGRPAALGCAEGALECDVDFTVTSAQQDVDCDDPEIQLRPDQQWLLFEIEAAAAPELQYPWSNTALFIENWSVEDPDGVATTELAVSSTCSSGTVPVTEALGPGTRVTMRVVVTAPRPASVLRLGVNQLSWSWRIPS